MIFKAVTMYEIYLARAKAVLSGAPYWKFISNKEYARLDVDGDVATLRWLDISSGHYGCYETEDRSFTFPARLLALPEKEFLTWKADERAKYDRERAEEEQARAASALAASEAKTKEMLAHGIMIDGKPYKLTPLPERPAKGD